MILLIAGPTRTGKTLLAQKMLEKYQFPYLCIDHLKMGLIRSHQVELTPLDDDKLTPYLWNIIKEIIKTAIENKQNLIVEGCYIPFDYKKYFSKEYLCEIKYVCLIFSENYICNHYAIIKKYENVIEYRNHTDYPQHLMIRDNKNALLKCVAFKNDYILIDHCYEVEYNL